MGIVEGAGEGCGGGDLCTGRREGDHVRCPDKQ